MLKLLKCMRNRERWMVLGCIALIVGQIYFDLTMVRITASYSLVRMCREDKSNAFPSPAHLRESPKY